MKSQVEIENYFTSTLNRQLDTLENQRREIVQSYSYKAAFPYIGGAAAISIAAYFMLKGMYGEAFDNNLPMFCILFTLGVAGISLMKVSAKRELQFKPLFLEYQSKVLGGITKFLNPDLLLEAEAGIKREEFEQSDLFSKAYNFESLLLTKGAINHIPLIVSQVRYYSIRKRKKPSRKVNEGKSKVIYFEGAYCILKINTGIPQPTWIREKSTVRDLIYDLFPNTETSLLSNTGNKNFDDLFSLHTSDIETSNKFKDSKLVTMLLDFKNQQNSHVQYYLTPGELHIAIGDFNMESINVNAPIDEALFTQTFINYTNDLIGFTEKLSESYQTISNTTPKK